MTDTLGFTCLGTMLAVAASTGCSKVELPANGSYNLTLYNIQVEQGGVTSTYSEGIDIRIDLHENGDGYHLISSPYFYPVSAGDAEVDGDELTLRDVDVRNELWSSIVLELDGDDGITGEGSATGVKRIDQLDYYDSVPMSGSARLEADNIAPVVRFIPEDTSTALLPWTTFYAYLSEPVPPDQVVSQLQAETSAGDPIEVTTEPWLNTTGV